MPLTIAMAFGVALVPILALVQLLVLVLVVDRASTSPVAFGARQHGAGMQSNHDKQQSDACGIAINSNMPRET